jgi:hypothetical protein
VSIVDFASARAYNFRPDFVDWLRGNTPIWERFDREASAVYARGRRHYSARTIGEYLRHETALKESPEHEWKLNDHRWPDLARLWLLVHPERGGFFELRESPQRRVA